MPDQRLKTYPPEAIQHLERAGAVLLQRQQATGEGEGNVPPWAGNDDLDFHGTLAAIWIWARHQRLSGDPRFVAAGERAWGFIHRAWSAFIPDALDARASDEAAYDCAMVLIACLADEQARGDARTLARAQKAARLLAAHLTDVEDLGGREFRDPGFLAYALLEFARFSADRGLLSVGRGFVERAFGMKSPPPFAIEPALSAGLFDFSSTTATRIVAVIAAEGETPFVGAWLRERIAAILPLGFLPRRLDENVWNACVAWSLGRAYVVSTAPVFLELFTTIMAELQRRDQDGDRALARDRDRDEALVGGETTATFYYALATDSLVMPEEIGEL